MTRRRAKECVKCGAIGKYGNANRCPDCTPQPTTTTERACIDCGTPIPSHYVRCKRCHLNSRALA